MSPALTIVLPVRDPDRLPKVLGALDAQRAAAPDSELLLVHVGHAARIDAALRSHGPIGWRSLRVPTEAPSASAARALGASRAQGDRVLFLDDSTTPEPGLLAAHMAMHARHPDAALQGQTWWSAEVAAIRPYLHWIAQQRWRWHDCADGEPLPEARLDPSNLSVPRGRLEEANFPAGIDAPYDARMALAGAQVRFCADAACVCERAWTPQEWLAREKALGAAAARAEKAGAAFVAAIRESRGRIARRRPRWLLATRWILGGGDLAAEWDAEAAHAWLAGYRSGG